ncbi:hypothetical protein IAT38_002966 [Cryptococcus sp. DSM 104549]
MVWLTLGKYRTLEGWQVPVNPSTFAPNGDNRWSNKDMDPVPEEDRKWTTFNYISYWVSDGFSPAVLQMAGAMIALGLSWKLALVAITLGSFTISLICVLNGTVGARLHTPFPVTARSSFGFWLSYFPVVSRLVLAVVYCGTKTYTGAEGAYQMIRAIWPSFGSLENHVPTSVGMSSAMFVSYFVYWVFQTPLMMLHPNHLRYLFLIKSVIGPIAGFAAMGWYLHKTDGYLYGGSMTLHGSKLVWAWFSAFNSAVGLYATLSVNIGDFTRYAKTPRAQYWQVVTIPVCFCVTAFMGIVIASGAYKISGSPTIIFDPLRAIDHWNNRAALFFFAFAMALSNLGSNISSNGLSAANDWTVLFPRYLNLRRGSFLTSIIVPWQILATGARFLAFTGGYTIFIAPIASIMVADYYIVHRQRIDIPALYDKDGRYKYRYGINWRALATLVICVPPNLPGLVRAINSKIQLPIGAQHLYALAWIFGTFSGFL